MKTLPICYEIRVEGPLPPQWMDWFEGLTIRQKVNGETTISGPVDDQAVLHGLPLLSVNRISSQETFQDQPNQE